MRKDLSDVYALRPEPHNFSHSRDAVLGSVDVLLTARVRSLDDSDQQREGLWTMKTDGTG